MIERVHSGYATENHYGSVRSKDGANFAEMLKKMQDAPISSRKMQAAGASDIYIPSGQVISRFSDNVQAAYDAMSRINKELQAIAKSNLSQAEKSAAAQDAMNQFLQNTPEAEVTTAKDETFIFSIGKVNFNVNTEKYMSMTNWGDQAQYDAFLQDVFGKLEADGGSMSIDMHNIGRFAKKGGVEFTIYGQNGEKVYDQEFYVQNGIAGKSDEQIKQYMQEKHGDPKHMTKKEFGDFMWDLSKAGLLPKDGPMICFNTQTGEVIVGHPRYMNEDGSSKDMLAEAAREGQKQNFIEMMQLRFMLYEDIVSKGLTPPTDYKTFKVMADFLKEWSIAYNA